MYAPLLGSDGKGYKSPDRRPFQGFRSFRYATHDPNPHLRWAKHYSTFQPATGLLTRRQLSNIHPRRSTPRLLFKRESVRAFKSGGQHDFDQFVVLKSMDSRRPRKVGQEGHPRQCIDFQYIGDAILPKP